MTLVDQFDGAAGALPASDLPPPPPPPPVRLRFHGRTGDYWLLMVRGAVLQAITLGIYRFWLFTDMRRFLWAATRIAGDTPEYTGTAAELFVGFLVAIGILMPIYAAFFLGSLELGLLSDLSPIIAFMALAAFGQYAAYRARRYRLTRTVFRGLRFHQTGSAVLYALRAMLWWVPVVLTLGLAWPWAMTNLERYKMRNTFFGTLGGSFAGSGTRLFGRGFLIWLVVIGPLAAGVSAAIMTIDWSYVSDALESDDLQEVIETLRKNQDIMSAAGVVTIAAASSALLGVLLYPAYQAIVMRWWVGGLRLGGATAASDLRIGRYYEAYVMYLAFVMLFSVAFFAIVGALAGAGYWALHDRTDFFGQSTLRDGIVTGGGIAIYVVYLLGAHTIYQVVVKMRLWRAAVESMVVSGYAAFDHVRADDAAASAIGEGLADALGGGGI